MVDLTTALTGLACGNVSAAVKLQETPRKFGFKSDSERRNNPMIPLLFVFIAQSTAQKCALEGTVVTAVTGAPLNRATVTVWPNRPGPKPSFTSSTDETGRFVIGNLDAGTYSLRAERIGYIGENYGAHSNGRIGTPLDLAAGRTMKDLTIQLSPEAMIYGRVLDDHGEPVPRIPVMVARRGFERGAGRLVSIDSGMSQADGSFVLGGLTAGTYYVCALPQNGGSSVADREQQERPVFSCFPNVPDVSSAAPIQVGPGDRFRGAEIPIASWTPLHPRRPPSTSTRGAGEPRDSGNAHWASRKRSA